jgi:hypothetical protein
MKKITTTGELTSFLDSFRSINDFDMTKEEYEVIKKRLATELDLPYFYVIPNLTPVYEAHIMADPTGELPFIVKVIDDKGQPFGDEFYPNLTSAYDYVVNSKAECVFKGEYALAGIEKDVEHGMIQEGTRLLISFTDDDRISLAKSNYLHFLFKTERYRTNPNDFYTAYSWVRSHPAFWYRNRADSSYWETGKDGFWLDISKTKSGDLVYMLEGGAAVEPERTSHYHDMRLDVYAPSFEEAYIQFAALVDKFFNVDGSKRENVSYEPSELEKTLTERLSKLNEEYGDNGEDDKK